MLVLNVLTHHTSHEAKSKIDENVDSSKDFKKCSKPNEADAGTIHNDDSTPNSSTAYGQKQAFARRN